MDLWKSLPQGSRSLEIFKVEIVTHLKDGGDEGSGRGTGREERLSRDLMEGRGRLSGTPLLRDGTMSTAVSETVVTLLPSPIFQFGRNLAHP